MTDKDFEATAEDDCMSKDHPTNAVFWQHRVYFQSGEILFEADSWKRRAWRKDSVVGWGKGQTLQSEEKG